MSLLSIALLRVADALPSCQYARQGFSPLGSVATRLQPCCRGAATPRLICPAGDAHGSPGCAKPVEAAGDWLSGRALRSHRSRQDAGTPTCKGLSESRSTAQLIRQLVGDGEGPSDQLDRSGHNCPPCQSPRSLPPPVAGGCPRRTRTVLAGQSIRGVQIPQRNSGLAAAVSEPGAGSPARGQGPLQ